MDISLCKRLITCDQLNALKTITNMVEMQNSMFNEEEMELCLKISIAIRNLPDIEENNGELRYPGKSSFDALIFLMNVFTIIENLTLCLSSRNIVIDNVASIFLELLNTLGNVTTLKQFYDISQIYLNRIRDLSDVCANILDDIISKFPKKPIYNFKPKGRFWEFCRKIESGVMNGLYLLDGKIPDKCKLVYPIFNEMAEWMIELSDAGLLQTIQLLQMIYFPSISVTCLFSTFNFFMTYKKGGYKALVKMSTGEINRSLYTVIKERAKVAKELEKEAEKTRKILEKEAEKERAEIQKIKKELNIKDKKVRQEMLKQRELKSQLEKLIIQTGSQLYKETRPVNVSDLPLEEYDRPTVEERGLLKLYESRDPTVQEVLSEMSPIPGLTDEEIENAIITEADKEHLEIRKNKNELIEKYIENYTKLRELNKGIESAQKKLRVLNYGLNFMKIIPTMDLTITEIEIKNKQKQAEKIYDDIKVGFDKVSEILKVPTLENLTLANSLNMEQSEIFSNLSVSDKCLITNMLNLHKFNSKLYEKNITNKPEDYIKNALIENKLLPKTAKSLILGTQPIVNLDEEMTRALVLTTAAVISPIRLSNFYHNWKVYQRPLSNIFRKHKLKTASELKDPYKPMQLYYSFWHSCASLGYMSILYSNVLQDGLKRFDPETLPCSPDELGPPCNTPEAELAGPRISYEEPGTLFGIDLKEIQEQEIQPPASQPRQSGFGQPVGISTQITSQNPKIQVSQKQPQIKPQIVTQVTPQITQTTQSIGNSDIQDTGDYE